MFHSPHLFRGRSLLALCCVAVVALPAYAQRFRFHVLGQDDGLLNLNFRSMVRDCLVYPWLGTDNDVFGSGISTQSFDTCDQYTIEGEAFTASVRGERPVPVPLETARGNNLTIDAVFQSAREQRWVTL